MNTSRAVAVLVAVALGALALLHLYWAAGGTWGLAAALGRTHVDPGPQLRLAAGMVSLGLAIATAGVLARVGIWEPPVPWQLQYWGTWILVGVLGFAGLINLTAKTALERLVYAPSAFALGALTAVVAASPRR